MMKVLPGGLSQMRLSGKGSSEKLMNQLKEYKGISESMKRGDVYISTFGGDEHILIVVDIEFSKDSKFRFIHMSSNGQIIVESNYQVNSWMDIFLKKKFKLL